MPPDLKDLLILLLLLHLEMGILFVKERNFLEGTNFFVKDSVARSKKRTTLFVHKNEKTIVFQK